MHLNTKSLSLVAALAATLAGPAALAAPVTLGGMGIAVQWTDRENGTGEMPNKIWGNADTVAADRIGLHVLFQNGLEGSIVYSGVSTLWNQGNFGGRAAESATGFFTAAQGLHFLFNSTASLPMAWISFSMPFSNNFDLDYNSGNSTFRASVAGWGSAVFTTYTSAAAVAAVPEPATLALSALALAGLAAARRRKA